MNLRTYRAGSMAEALAEVKKDLGKDAVILHTRTYKVGALMGVGGRQVIEITAADQATARGPRVREASSAAGAPSPDQFIPTEIPPITTRAVDAQKLAPRPVTPPVNAGPAVAPPTATAAPASAFQPPAKPKLATPVQPAPVDDAALGTLHDEIASIKRLVGQVLQCSRQTALSVGAARSDASPPLPLRVGGMSDPLFSLYMRLQEARVSVDVADAVIGEVRDELNPAELADESVTRQAVLRQLAKRIPVVGGMPRAGDGKQRRPFTIALVGPTGVGKTTTVAKLAAAYKLRQGKRVGLITSDTYRIAAVDQLRTYANIIGLPLKVVLTPRDMATACESLSDCDVIMIDTAGRSQHDATRLEELAAFIDAAAPDETHLVLSATVAEPVLLKAAERFGSLKPGRLVLSKLDEAVDFGMIANVAQRIGLPISFVTTGQEVPDHIELANADRLARTILDGEVNP